MEHLVPMLAKPATSEEALSLLTNEDWEATQKVDGVRLMVHVNDGRVTGVNRKGVPTVLLPWIGEAFSSLNGEWVFDGELVKGVYWVFDLPRALDYVLPGETPQHVRSEALKTVSGSFSQWSDNIRLLSARTERLDKLELAQEVNQNNGEGLVLKHRDAPYLSGKRTSFWRKWKFYATVDCVVIEPWRDGLRSMSVGVFDDDGGLVDIGSVAMTPDRLADASRGMVAEVRYLYANSPDEPRLYQPSFLRWRSDKTVDECHLSQLKYSNKGVIE